MYTLGMDRTTARRGTSFPSRGVVLWPHASPVRWSPRHRVIHPVSCARMRWLELWAEFCARRRWRHHHERLRHLRREPLFGVRRNRHDHRSTGLRHPIVRRQQGMPRLRAGAKRVRRQRGQALRRKRAFHDGREDLRRGGGASLRERRVQKRLRYRRRKPVEHRLRVLAGPPAERVGR